MCKTCDTMVAHTAKHIDQLITAEKVRRAGEPNLSNAQHTMGLATIVLEAFEESPDKTNALLEMAMGLALVTTRMIAAEQIYGATFS